MDFPRFQVVPIASFLYLFPWNAVAYLYTLLRSPPSLLFSRLRSPSSQPFLICVIFQSLNLLCSPLLDSSSMSVTLMCWGAQTWTQHPRWISLALSRGKDHLSWPSGNTSPNSAQDNIHLLCVVTQACRWLLFILVSSRTPMSFSAELLSSLYECITLSLLRCRTLHFPFLNFHHFMIFQDFMVFSKREDLQFDLDPKFFKFKWNKVRTSQLGAVGIPWSHTSILSVCSLTVQ